MSGSEDHADPDPGLIDEAPFDLKERRTGAAQAANLRAQANAGGLRFQAYLPSDLAVFVMLGEQQDLEQYPDLRHDLLRRTIEAADNDPRPAISLEVVMAELDAILAEPGP